MHHPYRAYYEAQSDSICVMHSLIQREPNDRCLQGFRVRVGRGGLNCFAKGILSFRPSLELLGLLHRVQQLAVDVDSGNSEVGKRARGVWVEFFGLEHGAQTSGVVVHQLDVSSRLFDGVEGRCAGLANFDVDRSFEPIVSLNKTIQKQTCQMGKSVEKSAEKNSDM